MGTCSWSGYNFTIYDLDVEWNQVAGIYIFSFYKDGYWWAVYIGQTGDFSARLPSHEKREDAIKKYGATNIHTLVVPDANDRNILEKTLIENHEPLLNTQHR